ncbi:MAG: phosphoribosylformylglycinamidine synthase subunit PurQ [Rhodothermales bacterium]
MSATFSVIVFPGSNCDHDAYHVAKHVFGQETRFIWHKETHLGDVDVVIVPGGFSYGDYLRAGAIARFSPIMQDVVRFANEGGLVLGICNGFQVLCECGLLPGALLRNASLRFACAWTYLRTENIDTPFTNVLEPGHILKIPIAHGEGNYFAEEDVLDRLETNRQILFRYCDADGQVVPEANPNGSARNIAGIINERGNVMGMMPHPERCAESVLGSADGAFIFRSLVEHLVAERIG